MNQNTSQQKSLVVNCPKCEKPVAWATTPFRPFCSKRCQTLDQADWATEEYRISSMPDNSSFSDEETN